MSKALALALTLALTLTLALILALTAWCLPSRCLRMLPRRRRHIHRSHRCDAHMKLMSLCSLTLTPSTAHRIVQQSVPTLSLTSALAQHAAPLC